MPNSEGLGLSFDNERNFQRLMMYGTAVLCVIWFMEERAGLIQPFDRYGYAALIVVTACCFVLSRLFGQTAMARVVLFVAMAVYLLSIAILAYFVAITQGNIYPLASTMLWMPIIYILAFLFLQQQIAVYSAIGIYCVLIMLLALSYSNLVSTQQDDMRVLLLNMVLSHGIYIFCLFGVLKLYQTHRTSVQRNRLLEKTANQDELLGIGNRRFLQAQLNILSESRANLSLLLIDVDHFKQINDQFGHFTGDQVLKDVSACMQSNLRPSDILGRWGGEEFLVIAADATLTQGVELAQRMREAVAVQQFDRVKQVTISVGVAQMAAGSKVSEVLNAADRALYRAKRGGRNRVESET